MSYVDQSNYSNILKNFAKGTAKGILQENYIDLMPINSLSEYSNAMVMSTNDAKYPGSMEEADLSPKQQKIARMAPPKDKITGADFAAMKKDEGIYQGQATGPTVQTVEGLSLEGLSLEERTELKNYVDSIKTTKKAIKELLQKARGGDMTNRSLQPITTNAAPETPETTAPVN